MKKSILMLISLVALVLISTGQAPVVAEPEFGPEMGPAFSEFTGGGADPNYGCMDCCSNYCHGFCNPGMVGSTVHASGACSCSCYDETDSQGNPVVIQHTTSHCKTSGRCG